jgi:hypothetical protein
MTEHPGHLAELHNLLEELFEDRIDDVRAERLESLLKQDPQARREYLSAIRLHGRLLWDLGGPRKDDCTSELNRLGAGTCAALQAEGAPSVATSQPATAVSQPLPIPRLLNGASNGMAGSLCDWPVAYLIATAIFAIGLIVGAVVHVSQPEREEQWVHQSPNRESRTPNPSLIVARVTGMVDCVWERPGDRVQGSWTANQKSEITNHNSLLRLGDRLTLRSGLLEITYDTGAQVVLQGPVTYQVESPLGGYLSVGKLTAKLDKKSEVRGQRSEPANQKSEISNHQFAVRTPAALVTDLGTEFAVEVNQAGQTTFHVFQGSVRLEPVGDHDAGAARILRANESARVVKGAMDATPAVERVAVDPASFVRVEQLARLKQKQVPDRKQDGGAFERWQAYSRELRRDPSLVAYYDFQQPEGKPVVLPNVAANGDHTLDGTVENAAWVVGRMPGKHALRFGDEGDSVRLDLPMKLDDMTLAACAYVEGFEDHFGDSAGYGSLLMSDGWNDRPGKVHWHVRSDGRVVFGVSLGCYLPDLTRAFGVTHRSQWRHIALTYDHAAARARFFIDGQMTDEAAVERHVPICFGPASIGAWMGAQTRCLHGRIDELAVFARPLKPEEIQRMYEAGRK